MVEQDDLDVMTVDFWSRITANRTRDIRMKRV